MQWADTDAVRSELDRILRSRHFVHAGRMSRFLRFVVEQALNGQSERLKEYVIAVEVFDRDSDFDPRIDSVVRVEAGRLRAKLETYYREEGSDVSVMITLPRGSYAPSISRRTPATASTPRRRTPAVLSLLALMAAIVVAVVAVQFAPTQSHQAPTVRIAVLPFSTYTAMPADSELALRLTEGVTAALVRRGDLAVISSTTARQFEHLRTRLRDVAETLDADILVEARIFTEEHEVVAEVRAVTGGPERKFWADTFIGTLKGTFADLAEFEQRIADSVATAAIAHR